MGSGGRRVSGELVRAYGDGGAEAGGELIAASPQSRALLQRLPLLTSGTVLICGETGTGKTHVAQLLHGHGCQPGRTLRTVNCAALGDALLADVVRELDVARSRGEAPGTVLFDEVGELSPWGQAVLLHRLQEEGSPTRFIAATHRELDALAFHGAFSRDLWAKLSCARITLSPLRARREDIVPMALHFLRLGLEVTQQRFVSVDPELFQLLELYDWPGNVRELKNAMSHALAVNESGCLGVGDLPDAVRAGPLRALRAYSR